MNLTSALTLNPIKGFEIASNEAPSHLFVD